MPKRIEHYRDLDVYQNAMTSTMEVFFLTKEWPASERYVLTDQILRSSRSVCGNIAEAWRKRRYKAAFISKLSDAETEASESQVWLEIAERCGYCTFEKRRKLDDAYDHIIGQLVTMIQSPDK